MKSRTLTHLATELNSKRFTILVNRLRITPEQALTLLSNSPITKGDRLKKEQLRNLLTPSE